MGICEDALARYDEAAASAAELALALPGQRIVGLGVHAEHLPSTSAQPIYTLRIWCIASDMHSHLLPPRSHALAGVLETALHGGTTLSNTY